MNKTIFILCYGFFASFLFYAEPGFSVNTTSSNISSNNNTQVGISLIAGIVSVVGNKTQSYPPAQYDTHTISTNSSVAARRVKWTPEEQRKRISTLPSKRTTLGVARGKKNKETERRCDKKLHRLASRVTGIKKENEALEEFLQSQLPSMQTCLNRNHNTNPAASKNDTTALRRLLAAQAMSEKVRPTGRIRKRAVRTVKEPVLAGSHFVFTDRPFVNGQFKQSTYNPSYNKMYLAKVTTDDVRAEYSVDNVKKVEIVAYKNTENDSWSVSNQTLHREWQNLAEGKDLLVLHVGGCCQSFSNHIQGGAKLQNEYRNNLNNTNLHVVTAAWNSYKGNAFDLYGYSKSCQNAERAAILVKEMLFLVQNNTGNKVGIGHSLGAKIWNYVAQDDSCTLENKLNLLLLSSADENSGIYQESGGEYSFYADGQEKTQQNHTIDPNGLTEHLAIHHTIGDYVLWLHGGEESIGYSCHENRSRVSDGITCLDGRRITSDCSDCQFYYGDGFNSYDRMGHSTLYSNSAVCQKISELIKEYCPEQQVAQNSSLVSNNGHSSLYVTARKPIQSPEGNVTGFCIGTHAEGSLASTEGREPDQLKMYQYNGGVAAFPVKSYGGDEGSRGNSSFQAFEQSHIVKLFDQQSVIALFTTDDQEGDPAFLNALFPNCWLISYLTPSISTLDKEPKKNNKLLATSSAHQSSAFIDKFLAASIEAKQSGVLVVGDGAGIHLLEGLKYAGAKLPRKCLRRKFGFPVVVLDDISLDTEQEQLIRTRIAPYLAKGGKVIRNDKDDVLSDLARNRADRGWRKSKQAVLQYAENSHNHVNCSAESAFANAAFDTISLRTSYALNRYEARIQDAKQRLALTQAYHTKRGVWQHKSHDCDKALNTTLRIKKKAEAYCSRQQIRAQHLADCIAPECSVAQKNIAAFEEDRSNWCAKIERHINQAILTAESDCKN